MISTKGISRIIAVGHYLPSQTIKTQDMLGMIDPGRLGIPLNYIADNVGIDEVRHADHQQRPSALAIEAAKNALGKTDINPDDIGLILFCGIEGDYSEPSTAHFIQAALKLKGVCFDISNACLGFMSGVQVANAMIASGNINYALICTGERPSDVSKATIDYLKQNTQMREFESKVGALTVGDAGGAMIIGRREAGEGGFTQFGSYSQGKFAKLCYYKLGKGISEGQMQMGRICALTIKAHQHLYKGIMDKLQWTPNIIDCLITHQVGQRPFEILSEVFAVSMHKMTQTYPKLGNITSATLPVNLSLGMEQGQIKRGDRLFVAMSGSGISVSHAGLTV